MLANYFLKIRLQTGKCCSLMAKHVSTCNKLLTLMSATMKELCACMILISMFTDGNSLISN